MIVFTATNLLTHDVYVGTARESVEEEWAELLAQAENGSSGLFFDQLREQGAAGFEVDTWAYGETPAEARESMREAREDLGAQPIKSSRGNKPTLRQPKGKPSASMKALMAVFEEAMSEEGNALDEDEAFEGVGSSQDSRDRSASTDASEAPAVRAEAAPASTGAAASDACRADRSSVAGRPADSVQTAASLSSAESGSLAAEEARVLARLEAMKAEEARMLARLEAMKAEQAQLLAGRQTPQAATVTSPEPAPTAASENTEAAEQAPTANDDSRMQARLEAMKAAQAKLLREREAAKPNTAPAVAKPVAPPPAAKLATGRTSSAVKERRIREAIEAERERREAMRQSQARDEHAEMTAVMARVEMRRLASKRAKAEKAKQQAAQARSARRAEERVKEGRAKKVSTPVSDVATAKPQTAPAAAKAPGAGLNDASAPESRSALKLAAGKTGSNSKEKRIKEAIEQEKAERLARQQAQRAKEADEMAAILNRLDERAKAAEKYKRRR